MNSWRLSALATMLILGVTCAATANAQQGAGAGRFGIGGAQNRGWNLLEMKAVHEELKLSNEQREKVTKIAYDAREGMRESVDKLPNASPEERREATEKIAKQSAETDKKVGDVLKPEQAARLKELSLQVRGTIAFTDPEVATALKLTDDQKKTLAEMAQASFPATGRRGTDDAGPADEERAARAKARAARKAKMLEVLTTEQRDQFTRLQGKKFDFPSQRGRS